MRKQKATVKFGKETSRLFTLNGLHYNSTDEKSWLLSTSLVTSDVVGVEFTNEPKSAEGHNLLAVVNNQPSFKIAS